MCVRHVGFRVKLNQYMLLLLCEKDDDNSLLPQHLLVLQIMTNIGPNLWYYCSEHNSHSAPLRLGSPKI